jgi:cell volume regulation protein A
MLVVRPVLVGLLMLPVDLRRGERLFVLLSGLKGAVPILLGTYVLVEDARSAVEIYDVVFVVVLISVLVQGGLVPTMIRAFRIPTRTVGPRARDAE